MRRQPSNVKSTLGNPEIADCRSIRNQCANGDQSLSAPTCAIPSLALGPAIDPHLFHFSLRSRCTASLAGLRTLIQTAHGPDR
jgi:hypothetical protein